MTATTRLLRLYDRIPPVACKRLCSAYCGPIQLIRLEAKRIASVPGMKKDCSCSLLEDGLCSRYDARPLICRLWGTVWEMKCPHGCEPERWLTRAEVMDIFREYQLLGSKFVGPGTKVRDWKQILPMLASLMNRP